MGLTHCCRMRKVDRYGDMGSAGPVSVKLLFHMSLSGALHISVSSSDFPLASRIWIPNLALVFPYQSHTS